MVSSIWKGKPLSRRPFGLFGYYTTRLLGMRHSFTERSAGGATKRERAPAPRRLLYSQKKVINAVSSPGGGRGRPGDPRGPTRYNAHTKEREGGLEITRFYG